MIYLKFFISNYKRCLELVILILTVYLLDSERAILPSLIKDNPLGNTHPLHLKPTDLPLAFSRLDKNLSLLPGFSPFLNLSLESICNHKSEVPIGLSLFHNLLSDLYCPVSPSQSKAMPELWLRIPGLHPEELPPWLMVCTSDLSILWKVFHPAMFCPFFSMTPCLGSWLTQPL